MLDLHAGQEVLDVGCGLGHDVRRQLEATDAAGHFFMTFIGFAAAGRVSPDLAR